MTSEAVTEYYEDNYTGVRFDTVAELIASLQEWSTPGGRTADLNMPVWVDWVEAEDGEPSRLEVGVFLPRHGKCLIKYVKDPAAEDAAPVREFLLHYWTWRAEAGFPRSTMRQSEEDGG